MIMKGFHSLSHLSFCCCIVSVYERKDGDAHYCLFIHASLKVVFGVKRLCTCFRLSDILFAIIPKCDFILLMN